MFMRHGNAMLMRGFHGNLSRHFVACGHGNVLADSLGNGLQDLDTMGLGHIMALGNGDVFGRFHRNFTANLVGHDAAPSGGSIVASVMSLGLGVSFSLGLSLTFPTTVISIVARVAIMIRMMRTRRRWVISANLFVNGLALFSVGVHISGLNFGGASLFVLGVAFLIGDLLHYRMTFGLGHRFAHLIVLGSIGNLDFRPAFLSVFYFTVSFGHNLILDVTNGFGLGYGLHQESKTRSFLVVVVSLRSGQRYDN